MQCPKCGKELQEGWVSCPHCGTQLPDVQNRGEAVRNSQEQISSSGNSAPSKWVTRSGDNVYLHGPAKVLAVILVAICVFILIGLWSSDKDEDKQNQSQKESSWNYTFVGDEKGLVSSANYSASVRVYEESGSLWIDYNGDDILNLSKSKISFTHKLLMYDKTVDGIAMYSSTCPDPFRKYMWGISADKRTLYYLSSGDWIKFTR